MRAQLCDLSVLRSSTVKEECGDHCRAKAHRKFGPIMVQQLVLTALNAPLEAIRVA